MIRTLETKAINSKLEVVKLCGQKFKAADGYYMPLGFAIKHPELGYFAFDGDYPYMPIGGKKALQSILNDDGFLNFDDSVWLKEMR